jgi:hypothetical protein
MRLVDIPRYFFYASFAAAMPMLNTQTAENAERSAVRAV